jgi:uncharacterized membrane protein YGL010W
MNEKLKKYFDEYASYHKTQGNQTSHVFGIPMIMLSLLGLLRLIPLGAVNLGVLLWLGATLFYVVMDLRLGVIFSLIVLGFYGAATLIPVSLHIVLFILGWVIQLIGHKVYEKNNPAFLKTAEHLLIGPLWIFVKLSGIGPKGPTAS